MPEISVKPTAEQLLAWSEAAGDTPLDAWLAELADEAGLARRERSWPVIIELQKPIPFGSQTVAQLEVRCGRLGDLKGIKIGSDEVSADQLLTIATRMSGQPMKVIENLGPDDAGELMRLVLDFLARSLTGGRKR